MCDVTCGMIDISIYIIKNIQRWEGNVTPPQISMIERYVCGGGIEMRECAIVLWECY